MGLSVQCLPEVSLAHDTKLMLLDVLPAAPQEGFLPQSVIEHAQQIIT
jgi:hypothetical protein